MIWLFAKAEKNSSIFWNTGRFFRSCRIFLYVGEKGARFLKGLTCPS